MDIDPSLRESGKEALEAARERLSSEGWVIRMETDPPARIVLHFGHELSGEHSVSFNVEAASPTERLKDVLERREFEVVRVAPKDIEHANLVRSLRQYARAYDWSETVFASVVRLLAVNLLVNEAEADWLTAAGPAWSREPPRS